MTVKQVLIGMVVGSSIIGVVVHRLYQAQDRPPHLASAKAPHPRKDQVHKTASLPKTRRSNKHSKSSELYG